MQPIRVRDLVNSCQHLWKGLFTKNKNFLITLEDQEGTKKTQNAWDLLEDSIYLMCDSRKEVLSWEMPTTNELQILVKELTK